jgi:hypothetical protein
MRTNLPALLHAHDAEQRPDPRCYALAEAMLRGHSVARYREARDFLAVAIWMEAKNTLDYILGRTTR